MYIRTPQTKKVPISLKLKSYDYLHITHDNDTLNIQDPNEIELELVDSFNHLGLIIYSNFK